MCDRYRDFLFSAENFRVVKGFLLLNELLCECARVNKRHSKFINCRLSKKCPFLSSLLMTLYIFGS